MNDLLDVPVPRLPRLVLPALLVGTVAAQESSFHEGPLTGRLGRVATLEVPAGYAFVDQEGMPAFNAATGNLHNPDDVGALYPLAEDKGWIVFFTFDPVGYVQDEDRDELDAGELLSSMKAGDEYANEERRKQGIAELHTVGWSTPPFYDERTKNLTWGLRLRSDGGEFLNHQVRVLGRHGVMQVILVASDEELSAASAELDGLLDDFSFVSGETYAEYRPGDRLAEYGLAGLVLGGGALAAGKLGLFAKLGKFLKVIVLGVVAVVAVALRRIKSLFGGGREAATEPEFQDPTET